MAWSYLKDYLNKRVPVSAVSKLRILHLLIGYDRRQPLVSSLCLGSILDKNTSGDSLSIHRLSWEAMVSKGLFWRTHTVRNGIRYDDIDKKPFSTDFAFTRFLIQEYFTLLNLTGWVLFCDDDFLFRASLSELFNLIDDKYAVMVVKHQFSPGPGIKMDGQLQQTYPRKNWSSLMLWNLDHPSNKAVTKEIVNTKPGAWLHGFSWLRDEEIGSLPEEWNWLEGHSPITINPKAVHFTRGGPWLKTYRDVPYADEWIDLLIRISSKWAMQ